MIIERSKYLNKLINYKDNGRVKIITGIRRCGKSFLIKELFKNYCLAHGVDKNHFIVLPLDDFQNIKLYNPIELDKYIRSLIIDEKKYYIVIDEIQNVFDIKNPVLTDGKIIKAKKTDEDKITFINVVLGLMQIPNVDLYITGSNSRFLSKDIVTDFRDRGDEIHVLPLSFSEFASVYHGTTETAYEEYALHGGMPRTLFLNDANNKEEYLYNLYALTYSKDVIERHKYKSSTELDVLTKVMASNIGSLTNSNTIANTFKSEEKIDTNKQRVDAYLNDLEDAYLISKVNRFDIRGRKQIGALYKYYYSDLGLRNSRLNFLHRDSGHVMENIIYNELIYRGYSVEVGVVDSFSKENNKTVRKSYETDFVVRKVSKIYYIQSAYDILNEEKYIQESKSLTLINDSFRKIIVVRQTGPVRHDEKGITTIGIIDFLLNENSLDE
jgi:predicted AAA+ superfamily ATPase